MDTSPPKMLETMALIAREGVVRTCPFSEGSVHFFSFLENYSRKQESGKEFGNIIHSLFHSTNIYECLVCA